MGDCSLRLRRLDSYTSQQSSPGGFGAPEVQPAEIGRSRVGEARQSIAKSPSHFRFLNIRQLWLEPGELPKMISVWSAAFRVFGGVMAT
jgi:hypothetical protein